MLRYGRKGTRSSALPAWRPITQGEQGLISSSKKRQGIGRGKKGEKKLDRSTNKKKEKKVDFLETKSVNQRLGLGSC